MRKIRRLFSTLFIFLISTSIFTAIIINNNFNTFVGEITQINNGILHLKTKDGVRIFSSNNILYLIFDDLSIEKIQPGIELKNDIIINKKMNIIQMVDNNIVFRSESGDVLKVPISEIKSYLNMEHTFNKDIIFLKDSYFKFDQFFINYNNNWEFNISGIRYKFSKSFIDKNFNQNSSNYIIHFNDFYTLFLQDIFLKDNKIFIGERNENYINLDQINSFYNLNIKFNNYTNNKPENKKYKIYTKDSFFYSDNIYFDDNYAIIENIIINKKDLMGVEKDIIFIAPMFSRIASQEQFFYDSFNLKDINYRNYRINRLGFIEEISNSYTTYIYERLGNYIYKNYYTFTVLDKALYLMNINDFSETIKIYDHTDASHPFYKPFVYNDEFYLGFIGKRNLFKYNYENNNWKTIQFDKIYYNYLITECNLLILVFNEEIIILNEYFDILNSIKLNITLVRSSIEYKNGILYAFCRSSGLVAYEDFEKLVWSLDDFSSIYNIIPDKENNVYFFERNILYKINNQGVIEWKKSYEGLIGSEITFTKNNNLLFYINDTLYIVNEQGEEIFKKTFFDSISELYKIKIYNKEYIFLNTRQGLIFYRINF